MKKKTLKSPELVNEEIVKSIYISEKSIWKMGKESNNSVEEIQELIDDYHQSLDRKMEYDKKQRKEIRQLFLEIKQGLEEFRSEIQPLPPSDIPIKSYCEGTKPLKRQGNFSYVIQSKI